MTLSPKLTQNLPKYHSQLDIIGAFSFSFGNLAGEAYDRAQMFQKKSNLADTVNN